MHTYNALLPTKTGRICVGIASSHSPLRQGKPSKVPCPDTFCLPMTCPCQSDLPPCDSHLMPHASELTDCQRKATYALYWGVFLALTTKNSRVLPACLKMTMVSCRFGFALIMWIVLFAMTFQRAVTAANADDRQRPGMWMWVAAPAIACLAYTSILGQLNENGALVFDNVSKNFMFMSLSLFFCLGESLVLRSCEALSVVFC